MEIKASLFERILLVWVLWAFIIMIGKSINPIISGIFAYPIVFIASFFGDAQASIVGGFISFGVSIVFIIWGITYSQRKRKNKKTVQISITPEQ